MIDFLKTYIEELIYVAIFVVIIELILPKGNMKKYVYSVVSIIILLLIISPILSKGSEVNIKGAIEGVIQTISKSSKDNKLEGSSIDFENFKTSVITDEVKEKIQTDVKEKLLNIGLEVEYIDIEVTDKYGLDEVSIYIKSLGVEENKSANKASEAISLIAEAYKLENSKIKIIELGGM